jgi:ammonium transporter, Amt family
MVIFWIFGLTMRSLLQIEAPLNLFGEEMNKKWILPTMATAMLLGTSLQAEDAAPVITATDAMFTANNVWMMLCTALVFLMHLGFATVETGFTQSKNTVNILFKNTMIVAIGLLTYTVMGFGLMYPGEGNGFIGFSNFMLEVPANGMTAEYHSAGYTFWTDFLFQGMFAATAATIVSGAVAERIKLGPFLLFATLLVAVSYPITGYWQWGGGWLAQLETPFYDFAGSTLVHAVGGSSALICAWMLGPRLKKFTAKGVKPILGHSMPLATIGVFLLWLGWFGFNGGSVLSADPAATSLVLVTTNLAAAAGVMSASIATWVIFKKPDLGMALNGALAGLVGITAGADQMSPGSAILIGAIAGVLVFLSVQFFDKIRIDDPVGAVSVHLVCGAWGTVAVGIFGAKASMAQFITQCVGLGSIVVFTMVFTVIVFGIIKLTLGVRVDEREEIEGLDEHEHGAEAYPYFSTSTGLL